MILWISSATDTSQIKRLQVNFIFTHVCIKHRFLWKKKTDSFLVYNFYFLLAFKRLKLAHRHETFSIFSIATLEVPFWLRLKLKTIAMTLSTSSPWREIQKEYKFKTKMGWPFQLMSTEY